MALDLESSDEGDRRNLRGNNTNQNSLEGISSPDSNVLFHSSSQDSKDKINNISTKGAAHPSGSKQDKTLNGMVRERSSPRRMEKRSKISSFEQLETTPRKDTHNSSFDLIHSKKKNSHKKKKELIIDTMADDGDDKSVEEGDRRRLVFGVDDGEDGAYELRFTRELTLEDNAVDTRVTTGPSGDLESAT